jgi:dUTP pyrophosphatase
MVDVMIRPRMPDVAPQPEFLPVQRLRKDAHLPARAHPWDAGLDLVAVEAVQLEPGGRGTVPTGIAVAIPAGWAGLVVPRSGLARRQGISLTNSPGLIDAGYRGEVQVLVINHDNAAHTIAAGERVAQLVLVPVLMADVLAVEALPDSDGRGSEGFGSSGR